MDRYLRPERFDIDPSDSSSTKALIHWRKTFENFIFVQKPTASETDAQSVRPTEKWDSIKFQLLVNHISPNIYTYISEATNYEEAITILQKLYVKPKNSGVLWTRPDLLSVRSGGGDDGNSVSSSLLLSSTTGPVSLDEGISKFWSSVSGSGSANSGQVLMKKFNRTNKYQPLVEEVELIHSNPDFSYIRLPDGRETTVSNRHLAPLGSERVDLRIDNEHTIDYHNVAEPLPETEDQNLEIPSSNETGPVVLDNSRELETELPSSPPPERTLGRSGRVHKTPGFLKDYILK